MGNRQCKSDDCNMGCCKTILDEEQEVYLKADDLGKLVIKGEMSLVGPRPEVPKYVAMYNESEREILKVRAHVKEYYLGVQPWRRV